MRARPAGVEVIGHRVGAQIRAAIGYVGVGLVVGLRDPVDGVGALTLWRGRVLPGSLQG